MVNISLRTFIMLFLFTCLPLIIHARRCYECYLNVMLLTDRDLPSFDHMLHALAVTRYHT